MYCLFAVLSLKGLMLLLTLYQLWIHNTLMYRARWQVKALLTCWRWGEKQGTSHFWNECEMECGISHSCLFQQFPPGSLRGFVSSLFFVSDHNGNKLGPHVNLQSLTQTFMNTKSLYRLQALLALNLCQLGALSWTALSSQQIWLLYKPSAWPFPVDQSNHHILQVHLNSPPRSRWGNTGLCRFPYWQYR